MSSKNFVQYVESNARFANLVREYLLYHPELCICTKSTLNKKDCFYCSLKEQADMILTASLKTLNKENPNGA